MRHFLAAIAFLTRIPVPTTYTFYATDAGKSARWFPWVGALIGVTCLCVYRGLSAFFPASVVAVAIVATETLLTGALHLDGLADMVDGFGGGHSREDVLRIMRDHSIGAFGAVALILVLGLKFASISFLIVQPRGSIYLILAPALARWTIVLDAVGGSLHMTALTDAAGSFRFSSLPPGTYRIREVSQSGSASASLFSRATSGVLDAAKP